ncbi:MAG: hypothetical protein IJX91_04040 [Clostridia bacterium]|nr:hypothetical protein [Clostridia bacterium]
MEPFSFFQILQSLLPKQSEPTTPADADATETVSQTEPLPPPDDAPTPTQNEPSEAQTAFLNFMDSHEQRARRTRK